MQMQIERCNANYNGNHGQLFWDYDGFIDSQEIDNNIDNCPVMSSAIGLFDSSPSASPFSSFLGATYIEHFVSKLDTLAGVAIKYGVDVSDIKKMNGLVTDCQMFALKSIQIPLPGRHSPSSCLSNGSTSNSTGPSSSNQSPTRNINCNWFESFQSLGKPTQCKVYPTMSSQGFYRLESTKKRISDEGCEMAIYSMERCLSMENGEFTGPSPNTQHSHQRKSISLIGLFDNNDSSDILTLAETRAFESQAWSEKPFRQRQKSEVDFTALAPEKLMNEEKNFAGGFSAITGRGLALRQNAGSRVALTSDQVNDISSQDVVSSNISIDLWEYLIDGLCRIRKSSSTSSLQDQDNGHCASIWPTSRWSLTAAIGEPIFDGLPKPMTGRRNKAALD